MSWHRPVRLAIWALVALTAATLVLDIDAAVRFALVAGFLLLAPGGAWALRMQIRDPFDTLAVGVALGLASSIVIASAMALTGWWHPGAAFVVLAALTVLGLTLPGRTHESDQADPDQLDQART